MRSLGAPRAFDELLAFQSVKCAANYRSYEVCSALDCSHRWVGHLLASESSHARFLYGCDVRHM